jgi:hypothetical protein
MESYLLEQCIASLPMCGIVCKYATKSLHILEIGLKRHNFYHFGKGFLHLGLPFLAKRVEELFAREPVKEKFMKDYETIKRLKNCFKSSNIISKKKLL